jgi:polar amino acid transport system substrate-binding protein
MTFPGRRINHERPKPVYENQGPSDHSKASVALSFHYFHSLGTGPKGSEMIKEGRSLKKGLCLLAVAMLGAGLAAPAYSQNASSVAAPVQAGTGEVRVAAFLAPPSVMQQNGSLTGFSVDLWSAIAARLKLKTSYQIMPDVSHLEEAMRSKSADLTLSLFITSARDEDFDFSIPTLQAGLQIMVRDTGEKAQTASPLWDMLRLIFSQTTAEWLGMALLLVLIPAHLIWLLERNHPDGIIANRSYFPGIFQAIYWAVSTLTTQSESMPRQWLARGFSIFWMFAGVVFVAFYTAQLTTTLTVEQIRGAIEGPGDLPGKQVATITRTTAADYLRENNAQVQEFPTPDQMFKALRDKKVDAVVSAAPLLLYYAAHEGKGLVKTVGPEFNTAPVAIMVPLDSPLRRKVNLALIALRENGTYQQIYDKWFGAP